MNALTPALPAFAALPELPPDLAAQVEALAPSRYGSGEEAFVRAPVAPRFHPAAPRLLPSVEHACRTPSAAVIRAWFTRLALAVRNPPAGGDFEARVSVIAQALADFPAAIWTSATLGEASRAWPWWPSAADVDALLRPHAERIWRIRDGLQRIAECDPTLPTPQPQQPSEPTEAEKLAVSLSVKRAISYLELPPEQRPRPRPNHLSGEALRLARASVGATP